MKGISVLFCFVLIVISCQKDQNNSTQNIPEQTLNNVSYGSDAAQKMDIYLPAGRETDTTKK